MKLLIVVVAVALAIFGSSFADDEEKKEMEKIKMLKIYKCLTCKNDNSVILEYQKCDKMRPEKVRTNVEICKTATMPEAKTEEERWTTVCKNEGGVAGKLYDCIMGLEHSKSPTDEELNKGKEFQACARKIVEKNCPK